jgi:hypothetical protein
MPEVFEQTIVCPYCAESISVLIDDSVHAQQYIDDCQVCCRPIELDVSIDSAGAPAVSAKAENE